MKNNCPHIHIEYIEAEPEVNIMANLICLDCGENLRLPEEDDELRYYCKYEVRRANASNL